MKAPVLILESPPGPIVRIDGREYLYFIGTGYLGLQARSEVIRAACEATERYGIHSATTRAGFGNSPPALLAERRLAELFGVEDAFHFASGYAAGGILLDAVAERFDAIWIDELAHYSVAEAARRRRWPVLQFHHRDADDLAASLHEHLGPGQRPLVVSDGVFSVRGTIAPAPDYLAVLADYPGGGLLLDDAHAVGVLGENGRGTFEHFGLFDGKVNGEGKLLCATASKALGGYGGFIPGSARFVDHARRHTHWFDGASPLPAAALAATAKGVELVMAEPDLRTRLRANVARLKTGLRAIGFEVDDSPVPIVCLSFGDAAAMQDLQSELFSRGIAIAYMAAYSGLGVEGGLRIAVFATHSEAMIDRLIDALRELA